jgi:putative monooxygenase
MMKRLPFPQISVFFLGLILLFGTMSIPASAKNTKKPAKPQPQSRRFFAFDEAPYFTSKDKRIGAKLLIDSTKVGPTLAAMQNLTYLPGAHVPSHRHVYVTEIIYVLKGNLTLRIDQETKVMGPDSTAYIPPQTFHEYANKSQDICQFLQFYAPSGPEEEYRNWDTPGAAAPVAAIHQATGPQVISAPPNPEVPGSPRPVLGTVVQSNTPAPATVRTASSPAPMKLELKNQSPRLGSATLQLRNTPPVVHPSRGKTTGNLK